MDLGGRIIIVFIITLISVHLLGFKESLYEFMSQVGKGGVKVEMVAE
jgi:hypothetical protein